MGKSNRPLVIAITTDDICDLPTILELRERGHVLYMPGEEWERIPDLVMGSNCRLMDVDHLPYLPIAMKEARKRKYGTKEE